MGREEIILEALITDSLMWFCSPRLEIKEQRFVIAHTQPGAQGTVDAFVLSEFIKTL